MQGIEFVRDKAARAPFDAAVDIGGVVARQAQQRGLIIRCLLYTSDAADE